MTSLKYHLDYNFLKDKVLYVEIEAFLLVEILYTGYKKIIKKIKINTIVKPLASSLRSESKKNNMGCYNIVIWLRI